MRIDVIAHICDHSTQTWRQEEQKLEGNLAGYSKAIQRDGVGRGENSPLVLVLAEKWTALVYLT